jgi:hypothetical protein
MSAQVRFPKCCCHVFDASGYRRLPKRDQPYHQAVHRVIWWGGRPYYYCCNCFSHGFNQYPAEILPGRRCKKAAA